MYLVGEESLTQYIRITLPCSPRARDLIFQMQFCVKTLKKIDEDITLNIYNIKENITNAIEFYPCKKNRSKYTNEVSFIIHKFINLYLKYHSLRFKHLCRAKQLVIKFKNLISEYLKKNAPIEVYFSQFRESVIDKVDKSISRLEFKLISLYHYVKNLPNIEKFHKITNHDLLEEMQKQVQKNEVSYDYVCQNDFDLMFETYIESNEVILSNLYQILNITDQKFIYKNNKENRSKTDYKFDERTQSTTYLITNNFGYFLSLLIDKKSLMTEDDSKLDVKLDYYTNDDDKSTEKQEDQINRKEFDITIFNNIVQNLYSQIITTNKNDYKMFTVFHCAVLRYLSNKYYINHSNDWIEKINDHFIQNCNKIIDQTPSDLKISKDAISSRFYDTKFRSILLNEGFQNAINHMFSIQFYTCPIEIWNEIKIAIDLAIKSVNKFSNSEDDISNKNISFDDFFSIVLPVFASSQIMSPTALHSFLLLFKNLPKTNSVDVAAVLAVALFEFVNNELN